MQIMCFFFSQMCCLFRLPSMPCMFCHRYPHPAFLSISTSKAFIITGISPHGRESNTAVDSGFCTAWILDSRQWNLELGFRVPIVSGIPDSLSCIPDSKAQDSPSKFSQILDYKSKNLLDSRIWIPLHEANHGHFFKKTLSLRLKAGKIKIHHKREISFGKSLEINST